MSTTVSARPGDALARGVDEHLGLGPRDEHARIHAEAQSVELLEAAQVGHRLAAAPPFDQLLVSRALRGGEVALGMREQCFLADAKHEGEQHVRVERGRAGIGRGPQARRRRGARLTPRRHAGSIVTVTDDRPMSVHHEKLSLTHREARDDHRRDLTRTHGGHAVEGP